MSAYTYVIRPKIFVISVTRPVVGGGNSNADSCEVSFYV